MVGPFRVVMPASRILTLIGVAASTGVAGG